MRVWCALVLLISAVNAQFGFFGGETHQPSSQIAALGDQFGNQGTVPVYHDNDSYNNHYNNDNDYDYNNHCSNNYYYSTLNYYDYSSSFYNNYGRAHYGYYYGGVHDNHWKKDKKTE
ncbi:unnamed protein product [Strongylus vulgaris]|uniref:Uncharacterized protein n=1 Tax=Strongylus vulgaris TaxID=40348 RepID=A0A3P7LPK5_STRVU|nr:unnamed protein product [Strongylus vulgaris]